MSTCLQRSHDQIDAYFDTFHKPINANKASGLKLRHLGGPEEMRANGAMDMLRTAWRKGLNAHILAWAGFKASTFFIYTKFEPKQSTKTGLDLTGIKMRSTGLYNPLLKAMGATPVNISPGDIYRAGSSAAWSTASPSGAVRWRGTAGSAS